MRDRNEPSWFLIVLVFAIAATFTAILESAYPPGKRVEIVGDAH